MQAAARRHIAKMQRVPIFPIGKAMCLLRFQGIIIMTFLLNFAALRICKMVLAGTKLPSQNHVHVVLLPSFHFYAICRLSGKLQ
jgi:hypothetical protein